MRPRDGVTSRDDVTLGPRNDVTSSNVIEFSPYSEPEHLIGQNHGFYLRSGICYIPWGNRSRHATQDDFHPSRGSDCRRH